MVKYKTKITPQMQDGLIDIILNNHNNTKKRKKLKNTYLIFGIFVFLIGFPSLVGQMKLNGLILVTFSILLITVSYKIQSIQKFLLKQKQKRMFKKTNSKEKEIEYEFSDNGVRIINECQESKNSWDNFKSHGAYKNFIYLERNDEKLIIIDTNVLSEENIMELNQLFSNIG